jgi:hypothetical protein
MVKLILVEYLSFEQNINFELFENIKKAFEFCKRVNVKRIDLVDVNKSHIFYDESGGGKVLNYEDNAGLIKQGILSDIY